MVAPRRVAVGTEGEAAVELAVPPTRLAAAVPGRPRGSTVPATDPGAGSPIPVPGLRATARSRGAGIAGFHRRAASGGGYYVTRDDIERQRPVQAAEIFRGVPALEVMGSRVRLRAAGALVRADPSALPTVSSADIGSASSAPPAGLGVTAQQQAERRAAENRPVDCVPSMYLDGSPWEPASGDLSGLRPGDIEGVEVYPRATLAPAQFRRRGSDCGVILIWLKEREDRN